MKRERIADPELSRTGNTAILAVGLAAFSTFAARELVLAKVGPEWFTRPGFVGVVFLATAFLTYVGLVAGHGLDTHRPS